MMLLERVRAVMGEGGRRWEGLDRGWRIRGGEGDGAQGLVFLFWIMIGGRLGKEI